MSTQARRARSHHDATVEMLRADPELAAEYLRTAMEENQDCMEAIKLALRRVAEAQGMQAVAEQAGIKRESLYRALSPKGNPTLNTLSAVLKAVGLRLSVDPRDARAC